MGRFQLESIYLYFHRRPSCYICVSDSSQETEVTSTPTKPVDNVVIAARGLQDRNTNVTAGTTVENKGKLILNKFNSLTFILKSYFS